MKSNDTRRKFLAAATKGTGVAAAALIARGDGVAKEPKLQRRVITKPGQKIAPKAPYSPAIQLGNFVYVSGQIGTDPATQKLASGTFEQEVRQCLENLKAVVEASGSSMDRVLKCTVFLTDISNFKTMNEIYIIYFPADPPARSTVAVKELVAGAAIEIDCFTYTG